MPASVTIMPEKEWPTRTVGPSCRASTRSAEATASRSVVKGFCTEVTFSPAACKRGITSDQLEPSGSRAVEKVRRLIIMSLVVGLRNISLSPFNYEGHGAHRYETHSAVLQIRDVGDEAAGGGVPHDRLPC